jgi:hypothetical protein
MEPHLNYRIPRRLEPLFPIYKLAALLSGICWCCENDLSPGEWPLVHSSAFLNRTIPLPLIFLYFSPAVLFAETTKVASQSQNGSSSLFESTSTTHH